MWLKCIRLLSESWKNYCYFKKSFQHTGLVFMTWTFSWLFSVLSLCLKHRRLSVPLCSEFRFMSSFPEGLSALLRWKKYVFKDLGVFLVKERIVCWSFVENFKSAWKLFLQNLHLFFFVVVLFILKRNDLQ